MTYIVMECHKGYVILLGEDGRFVKAADLLTIRVRADDHRPGAHAKQKVFSPHCLADCCTYLGSRQLPALLLFFGFGILQHNRNVYTSIYLAINPQVQMDLGPGRNRRGAHWHK